MIVFRSSVSKEVINLNEVIRLGPKPNDLGCLLEEKIYTQTHIEGRSCKDTGRRQSSTSQGGGWEVLGETNPVDTLISDF